MALEFDAADSLESPESHPVAMLTGVADRIAALEMLLYPSTSGNGLLGDLAASLGIGGSSAPVPPERSNVPLTFLVWGPGRILPVRITTFSVEEQEFMTMLYPLRAKVSLTLQILRENDYAGKTDELSTDLAKAAWKFYRTQQQVLAVANIANSVESILGMLPI